MGILERLRNLNIKPNLTQKKAALHLTEILKQLDKNGNKAKRLNNSNFNQPKGLYMWGSVGSGKSLLLDTFHLECLDRGAGAVSKRVHFNDLMREIHFKLHLKSTGIPASTIISQIGKSLPQILCLDEVFLRDIAESMLLKSLLDSFWDRNGIVVATSNRPPHMLYEKGLNRALVEPLLKRFEAEGAVFEVSHSVDYRTEKGASRQTCFYRDLERFRADFLNHGQSTVVDVQVTGMNRSFPIELITSSTGRKRGVVYVSFEKLCRENKSVNDYKALVDIADTIHLSDVDPCAETDMNAFTRFIQLVDVAYEGKSRILVHSNTLSDINQIIPIVKQAPTSVVAESRVVGKGGSSSSASTTYIGEVEWSATGLVDASLVAGSADNSFSVNRTISRLTEMHSRQWDTESKHKS